MLLVKLPTSMISRMDKRERLWLVCERDENRCNWCSRFISAKDANVVRLFSKTLFSGKTLDNYSLACTRCKEGYVKDQPGFYAWKLMREGFQVQTHMLNERFEALSGSEVFACIKQQQTLLLNEQREKLTQKTSLYKKLAMRDGEECVWCRKELILGRDNLTVDHVIPKRDNGANAIVNLVLACYDCNHERLHTPVSEWILKRPKANRQAISNCLSDYAARKDLSSLEAAIEMVRFARV